MLAELLAAFAMTGPETKKASKEAWPTSAAARRRWLVDRESNPISAARSYIVPF
jgi:hypothetical protein